MKKLIIILFLFTFCQVQSQELGLSRRQIVNDLKELINETTNSEITYNYIHKDDRIVTNGICNEDTITNIYYLNDDDSDGEICDSLSINFSCEDCYIEKIEDILKNDFVKYLKLNSNTYMSLKNYGSIKTSFSPKIYNYKTMSILPVKELNQYRITIYYKWMTKKEFNVITKN